MESYSIYLMNISSNVNTWHNIYYETDAEVNLNELLICIF